MSKNVRISVAAIVILGAVSYSKWQAKHDDATSPEKTSIRGQFSVPMSATSFKLGQFDFKQCELEQRNSGATTAAFCAPFEVPENHAAPEGRKISLNLALIRSREAADDDFIVYLAGGPGQAAIDTWPQMAGSLDSARKRRNVILLDQRGTGGSNALNCTSITTDEESQDFDPARVSEAMRKCLAEVSTHADPQFYTTSDAVQDLETLRLALGGPKFDLVGVSYGTRVAQQYLKRHPAAVRSVVLDSVAPNELILGNEFSRNLDDALKAQFSKCAENADCAKAFPDPYASLIKLRDQLNAEPRQVSYPDPVNFTTKKTQLNGYGMAGLVRMFAYGPETSAVIPLTINEALAGNYAPMMGQLAVINNSISDLVGSGMQLSVICAEDADRIVANPEDASTLLGTLMTDVIKAQCAIWPKGKRPDDFNEPVSGSTPILVLAGEFDPVTPPRYAEQVMTHLDNARLILAKGQGHNVIGRGCIPKLVSQFMDTLEPSKLDITCVDTLGAVPHFINFNGASP